MFEEPKRLHLPKYSDFLQILETLPLPMSGSALHGVMCGYLCAGADSQCEVYLRALLNNKKDQDSRAALLALFAVFTVSQQQMSNYDFHFELMLPDEETPLLDRAQAFSEWCDGFTQGLDMVGIDPDQFYEEEAQEAYLHISEFADLDYGSLNIAEEDEKALMEVSEYTRMAVLRLHGALIGTKKEQGGSNATH